MSNINVIGKDNAQVLNGLVYMGKAVLCTRDEKYGLEPGSYDKMSDAEQAKLKSIPVDEMVKANPMTRPHVYLDVSGVAVHTAIRKLGGNSVTVPWQRYCRGDGSFEDRTLAQLNSWRDGQANDPRCVELAERHNGEAVVILTPEVGKVPLTVEEMRAVVIKALGILGAPKAFIDQMKKADEATITAKYGKLKNMV